MSENKVLEFELGTRSEASGKLTKQQLECLDHEIQIIPRLTESQEIQGNLGLRKPQVGYGKPPRHTQFKPGQSGNPRGRPKSPKSFDELIEKELAQLVTVREGDRAQRLPKRSVIVKQVVKKAMEGEDRALRSLLTLIGGAKTEKQQAAAKDEADPDAPLTNTEKGILEEYEAQLREKILQEQASAADSTDSNQSKEHDK